MEGNASASPPILSVSLDLPLLGTRRRPYRRAKLRLVSGSAFKLIRRVSLVALHFRAATIPRHGRPDWSRIEIPDRGEQLSHHEAVGQPSASLRRAGLTLCNASNLPRFTLSRHTTAGRQSRRAAKHEAPGRASQALCLWGKWEDYGLVPEGPGSPGSLTGPALTPLLTLRPRATVWL